MVFYRRELATLGKRVDVINEGRLDKPEAVDEHSLSDEQIKSMMGAFVFSFLILLLSLFFFYVIF